MIINHVLHNYSEEKWKNVEFDFEYENDNRLEVSNLGRVRSFNKMSDGNILKLSTINGYEIIRLKFFKKRNEATDKKLAVFQKEIYKLISDFKQLKVSGASNLTITTAEKVLVTSKKALKKKFAEATKKRTINYHSLIHRLVVSNFSVPPSSNHTIVAHKDYDKLNNKLHNLVWMTPEENYSHQQKSPLVIEGRLQFRDRRVETSKVLKLTVTKVMLLKKLLNQGKPVKQLVKQFKVTDTQIFRIKRGENWGDIKAAT